MPTNGHHDEIVATDTPALKALDRARVALRQNQPDLAARWCAEALVEDPDLEAAIQLAAALACQRGDFKDGVDGFRRLTELKPKSATAWLNLGKALIESGQLKAGMLALERTLGLEPGNLDASVLLGISQRDLGHLDAAADTLKLALERAPDHVPALQALGAVLAFGQRHDEAAALFRRVLELRPDGPVAHYNLGRTLLALGEPQQAAEHFRAALTVNHHYPDARIGLGQAAEAEQQWAEAQHHYQRVLRRHPGHVPAADRLLALLIARRRLGEARAQLEQLAPRLSDDLYPLLWEARLLAAEGRGTAARERLQALAERDLPGALRADLDAALAELDQGAPD